MVYTIADLTKLLKRSSRSVTRLIESGELQGFNAASSTDRNAAWRVTEESLQKFIADRTPKIAGDSCKKTDSPGGSPQNHQNRQN